MSEEQQYASFDSSSLSRSETIELLQGTARRFQELIKKLNEEPFDYQLPKRSYKNLLSTSEQIFNSIQEVSGSSAINSLENIDFDRDYSGRELTTAETIELLQTSVDFFEKMVEKITTESLEYQLPSSVFETLIATTEKIVNPFGTAPTTTTLKSNSKPRVKSEYSAPEFTADLPSSNKINWPWLGVVAVILAVVISLSLLFGNQKSIREEIATEVPQAKLEFTAEQKALAAIEKQIENLAATYDKEGMAIIKPNFVTETLTIQLANNWQELAPDKKEKITNKWLEDSRKLQFKKLEIIDEAGVLVARSPIIGKNIVILQP